jgi:hypothetical protein
VASCRGRYLPAILNRLVSTFRERELLDSRTNPVNSSEVSVYQELK